MTVKELKDFIKDLPDETKVINNLSKGEEVALVYKKVQFIQMYCL